MLSQGRPKIAASEDRIRALAWSSGSQKKDWELKGSPSGQGFIARLHPSGHRAQNLSKTDCLSPSKSAVEAHYQFSLQDGSRAIGIQLRG